MIRIYDHLQLDPLGPLPFPAEKARSMESPTQRQRTLRRKCDRNIEALAMQLGCLGWFDAGGDGPRAA
ncbi:MAG: hypothetical protein QF723_05905 [Phycisphaerales bacterium]|jgi:hypothetical protein|nr:hypothetical protein [Phycisphaerales bacterium]MDP6312356.1 hypothetical protein [Phycisphaerales bacterium]MDP7087732.1 hypothetical protein [Phycisphaerales bacterium]MDP7189656.1 hypothetical protein [Phycisphaerales bacterium]MDP7574626.1 hypothetical protein [Phycisphaerales bacterium]